MGAAFGGILEYAGSRESRGNYRLSQRYRQIRLQKALRGEPAPDVDNQPGIRDLNVPRRTLAVTLLRMRRRRPFHKNQAIGRYYAVQNRRFRRLIFKHV